MGLVGKPMLNVFHIDVTIPGSGESVRPKLGQRRASFEVRRLLVVGSGASTSIAVCVTARGRHNAEMTSVESAFN